MILFSMELFVPWFCMLLLVAFFIQLGEGEGQNQCERVEWCGDQAIRFPFRLKGRHPYHCGYPGFELSCTEKRQTVLELPNIPTKFYVGTIDYEYQELGLYDPENNCLLTNIHLPMTPFYFYEELNSYSLLNCSTLERKKQSDKYFPMRTCLSGPTYQIYAVDSTTDFIDELPIVQCTKVDNKTQYLLWELMWHEPNCTLCERNKTSCRLKSNGTGTETECFLPEGKNASRQIVASGVCVGAFVLIVVTILGYREYRSNRLEKESQLRIQSFLEDYKALKPSRYSYADIKRITDQFKDNLGQGAYGTVYKGNISADCSVAVKILNSLKGDGEDFINEVGTMGRIHHVNVARLVGFCAEGFRRALVYQFLPNGSLQKYISLPDTDNFLGWEKLQDIALGIAKGIEYLHQGCDQQILHFDIKPHNVLLDHNFTPKISDFGLAKLCSKDQSMVSMNSARGTMGYIAPEVFSRNFGKASYKSDVYSFGMLLLEMVGGRKNTDVTAEETGEIYYPEWIYNLLDEGEDLRIHIEKEGDAKIAKKLAIVGLWCIQWYPVDRPSMKVVLHMLEAGEELSVPPNPFGSIASTKTAAKRMKPQLEAIEELE